MLIRPNLSASDNRRIQAMLRGNQNGDLAQMLLDGAPFLSELTHTAVPQRAAAGTTAAFTRATTATFTDFEGVLRTAPAGCARFVGARFVRNLLASVANLLSEDLTSAGWTANAVTKAAGSITETAASSLHYISNNAVGTIGRKHIYQMRASLGSGTRLLWTGDGVTVAEFNLQAGTAAVVAGSGSASMTLVTTGVYDCYLTINSQAATVVNIGLASSTGVYNYAGNGTSSINVSRIQVEDITGRADQTTPSEYVSVGVESAPYHGAGADGCQFFDTDLDGNPIPAATNLGYLAEGARTNYITQSNNLGAWTPLGTPAATQNAVGPNGQANYAWTLTDNDAAGYEGVQTVAAFAAGAAGCFSVLVAKKASSPSYPGIQFYHNTAGGATTAFIINEVAGTMVSFGTVAATAYGCVSYNEDFWLVWCSNTQAGGSLSAALELYAAVSANGSTPSAAGQGSTAFSDAQFEQGTTHPSSRIATTTVAVTRNADVLTYSGGDIPNLKTLMAGFRREVGVSGVGGSVVVSDGTVNNYSGMYLASAPIEQFSGVVGGVIQWNQSASNTYVPGVASTSATSFTTNDIKMSFNGVGQTPDTVANVPTVTQLNVGHIAGAFQLDGNVGPIYGWTSNKSQSELNAVTTP